MASLEELRDERLKKKALLEEKGIDPYPAVSSRTHTIKAFQDDFTALVESNKDITIVGRIMSKRGQGALMFCDLFDGTARTQLFLKSDEMDEEAYALFNDTTDIGDFVQATGRGRILFESMFHPVTKTLCSPRFVRYGTCFQKVYDHYRTLGMASRMKMNDIANVMLIWFSMRIYGI